MKMQTKFKNRENFLLMSFVSLLVILFLLFKNFLYLTNFFGEKLFLGFHLNNLAIKVLEFPDQKNAQTYFLLGRIYFVEGNLPKAIQQFDKAIGLDSSVKEYYYGRALSYAFTSKDLLPYASQDFEKYLSMDEENFKKTGRRAYGAWAGYNDLAWTYYLQKDFKKAEEAVKAGLEISGSNAWLLNMYGSILIEEDRCGEALPKLKQAQKLISKTTTEKYGEAYSGDNSKFWGQGKDSMESMIIENIKYCENTFPHSRSKEDL